MKNEYVFQQLWAKYALSLKELLTTEGEQVLIFNPGTLNIDQGADFKNAHIRIGKTEWFGNIELHLRTSDWFRHGHDNDHMYRNIILHVVWKHDVGEFNNCPVLELGKTFNDMRLPQHVEQTFDGLNCTLIHKRPIDFHDTWIERWLKFRVQRKVNHYLKIIEMSKGDIEQVAWISLARCFGYKVNADCFEDLARSLPINILRYHTDDLTSVEALLFGQMNLLPKQPKDDYTKILSVRYQELKWKYDLIPLHQTPVFLRMRPLNFPTIRLAQLASLIKTHRNVMDQLLSLQSREDLYDYFTVEVSPYWLDHYQVDKASCSTPKKIGLGLINTIIINMILPIQIVMNIRKGNKNWSTVDLSIFKKLPPDESAIITQFRNAGIKPVNAFQSQALLELHAQKCIIRECDDCSFFCPGIGITAS